MTLIDKAEALAVVNDYWQSIGGGLPEGPSDEAILGAVDAIAERIAALPARGVGVQWQEINTAPRGGEWFIARTEHGTTRVVRFADEYDRFPISHDDVVWPTAPTEWTPLKPILAAIAPTDAAQVREAAMQELIEAYADIIDYGPLVLAKKDQWKRVEAAKEKLK